MAIALSFHSRTIKYSYHQADWEAAVYVDIALLGHGLCGRLITGRFQAGKELSLRRMLRQCR